MKKIFYGIFIILISAFLLFLTMGRSNAAPPKYSYQVYFDGKIIGVVSSKNELYTFIDEKNTDIKKKYNTQVVKAPTELITKKVFAYNKKIDEVETVYNRIAESGVFTIEGYEFKIKNTETEKVVYTTNKDIFEKAVDSTIETFVGKEKYEKYKNNSQEKIDDLGTELRDVYVSDNITVKKVNVSINEVIYTDSKDLAQFLLFGDKETEEKYIVKAGDTIESVAFDNKISVDEFLISNPNFKSETNLLFIGQEVNITQTNPQIHVYTELYVAEESESNYKIEESVDESMVVGDNEIIREGEKGLQRTTRVSTAVNGQIVKVDTLSKIEIKPSISQVVVRGGKKVSNIGNTYIWGWPTNSGWVITSPYAYRINPISGVRELHDGIDIAGTGYGSPLYAANHGTVYSAGWDSRGGNQIIINHNNGYYTIYAHASKLLVKKGQTVYRGMKIAEMGSTGWSTGTHLHFGTFKGVPYGGGYAFNPFTLY